MWLGKIALLTGLALTGSDNLMIGQTGGVGDPVLPSQNKDKRQPKVSTCLLAGEFYLKESSRTNFTEKQRQETLESARQAFQQALDMEPGNPDAFAGLGKVFTERKDYSKALATYKMALKIHPKNVELWRDLAYSHGRQKAFEKAIECCRKALDIEPEDRTLTTTLGLFLARAGKPQEAETVLTKVHGKRQARVYVTKMLFHMSNTPQANKYIQSGTDVTEKVPGNDSLREKPIKTVDRDDKNLQHKIDTLQQKLDSLEQQVKAHRTTLQSLKQKQEEWRTHYTRIEVSGRLDEKLVILNNPTHVNGKMWVVRSKTMVWVLKIPDNPVIKVQMKSLKPGQRVIAKGKLIGMESGFVTSPGFRPITPITLTAEPPEWLGPPNIANTERMVGTIRVETITSPDTKTSESRYPQKRVFYGMDP